MGTLWQRIDSTLSARGYLGWSLVIGVASSTATLVIILVTFKLLGL